MASGFTGQPTQASPVLARTSSLDGLRTSSFENFCDQMVICDFSGIDMDMGEMGDALAPLDQPMNKRKRNDEITDPSPRPTCQPRHTPLHSTFPAVQTAPPTQQQPVMH